MRILSIQSSVAHGHVGNSAAVFPLQRIGHEVLPVFTVHFSNHTGYGAWRGPVLAAEDVHQVILGIEERGALAGVDLVLSGYLGHPDIVAVVLDAVERVKKANPAASYACDPVMGNPLSGCFVDPAIPPLIRDRLVAHADVVTPNQFELGLLTGVDGVLEGARAARALGPSTVLVTSVEDPAKPEETGMVAVTGDGAWSVRTPRLPRKTGGSGDVTAALFSAHLLSTGDPGEALARTASSVFDLLSATHEADSPELLLVESQEYYAHPRRQFAVRQLP
ncbi:MAG: pyridoxal kinase PdxY [Nocardioidaceae bacterium]|nr:pyridoxal kinase PdxY [Nocardioidaceae bacterium]